MCRFHACFDFGGKSPPAKEGEKSPRGGGGYHTVGETKIQTTPPNGDKKPPLWGENLPKMVKPPPRSREKNRPTEPFFQTTNSGP